VVDGSMSVHRPCNETSYMYVYSRAVNLSKVRGRVMVTGWVRVRGPVRVKGRVKAEGWVRAKGQVRVRRCSI